MAISNLMPRKTLGGWTRWKSMEKRHKYDQKDEKTRNGELISSYMCSPETAAEEFEISKQLYYQLTGRSQPKSRDIIMYRIIQSFKPGEITPEDAHKIAWELAMRFTKGQHQFVVSTHVDTGHIHSHIEFNSTNLDCTGKFENVKDSAMILRRLNDALCREHGLSVIENPQKESKAPGEAFAMKHGVSFKELLRQAIERVLPESRDFEDFLARMRAEGYEIKQGKYLEFKGPGQQRFTRSFRLGDAYTVEALRERCGLRRGYAGGGKAAKRPARQTFDRKFSRLIDIQKKVADGKGPGYEHWAGIFNLQEAAKTLNFLIDNNLTDYDELAARAEKAGRMFDLSARKIKKLEARMAEIAQLKTHIIRYAKTRDVYAAYRKARNKEEFLAAHGEEIAQHEAAKRAFDALEGKPIPKVAELSKEYAALRERKQREYEQYRKYRHDLIELQTAKQNIERVLGIDQEEQDHRHQEQANQEQAQQEQSKKQER